MPPVVVIDFETRSACDLKKAGAWRYAEDPSTEVLCLGYAIDDGEARIWTPDLGPDMPTDLRAAMDAGAALVAHNVQFERAIWVRVMGPRYDWPPAPGLSRFHDTMASCGYRAVPLKLEKAADVLGLKQQKDMGGNRLLNQVSKPKKDGTYDESFDKLERTYDYCAQDVRAERELWQRLGPLPASEYKLWRLDQEINRRGVQLDLKAIKAAKKVVGQVEKKLLKEFEALVPGLRPSQRDKFMAWLKAEGLDMPDMRADTVEATLARGDLPDNVRRAVEIRSILSLASIKKLDAMLACVCSDGRARGLLQYHGATTGRWSGRLFQPQNFPRGKYHAEPHSIIHAILCEDADLLDTIYGDAMQAISDALRPMMIAGPGRDLACVDFSAIEAVVLACLAGETWKIDAFRRREDIYCATASRILRRDVTKDGDPEGRQIGKIAELAFGYGGGVGAWKAFDSSDRSDEDIDEYKNGWRARHPGVVAFWRGLEDASIGAVLSGKPKQYAGIEYRMQDGCLTCRLPSGRLLWYNEPKVVWRPVPWDDEDERPSLEYKAWRYGAWRTIHAYGGLNTENVVQATARDLLAHAMFQFEANGYPLILTVHDENLAEVPEGQSNMATMIEIATDAPDWARGWPINAEGWIGKRYRKD